MSYVTFLFLALGCAAFCPSWETLLFADNSLKPGDLNPDGSSKLFSCQQQAKPEYFETTSLVAESNMDLNSDDDLSPPLSPSALDLESTAPSQHDGRERD